MRINIKKGNISLSTVLVTSSILLLMGVTLILSITDFSRASSEYFNHELNEVQSKTCIEEALQKIKTNLTYNGTFNLSFPNGTCTVIVALNSTNSNYRDISIESTYRGYRSNIFKIVDVYQNPFVLFNSSSVTITSTPTTTISPSPSTSPTETTDPVLD